MTSRGCASFRRSCCRRNIASVKLRSSCVEIPKEIAEGTHEQHRTMLTAFTAARYCAMHSRRVAVFTFVWFALLGRVAAQSIVTIVSPTNGTHFEKAVGMELNISLQAQVTNPGPGANTVYFYANGVLVAVSTPSGSTTWSNAGLGSYLLTAGTVAGMPTSIPVSIHVDTNGVSLINELSAWKYLDGGIDPSPFWFQPEADLGTWPTGVPQFGFGEGDERTIVNFLNQTNGEIYPAYYFHTSFIASNVVAYSNLVVRLLRDDGVIAYLNGNELFRENMPNGSVNYLTYASAGAVDENTFTDHWINPTLLVEGTNHMAVEIHNQAPHSEDIGFDLRLLANLVSLPPRLTISRTTTNVILSWPRSYLGYRLQSASELSTNGWEVLTNVSAGAEFRSTNTPTGTARFFRLSLD